MLTVTPKSLSVTRTALCLIHSVQTARPTDNHNLALLELPVSQPLTDMQTPDFRGQRELAK